MGLTVREHLVLAHRVRHARSRAVEGHVPGGIAQAPRQGRADRVDGLLDLLLLTPFANQLADTLPLGTSRLVEVGRALAVGPSVILLDEPLAGLDAHEADAWPPPSGGRSRRRRCPCCSSSTTWAWSSASRATSTCWTSVS